MKKTLYALAVLLFLVVFSVSPVAAGNKHDSGWSDRDNHDGNDWNGYSDDWSCDWSNWWGCLSSCDSWWGGHDWDNKDDHNNWSDKQDRHDGYWDNNHDGDNESWSNDKHDKGDQGDWDDEDNSYSDDE